MDVDIHPYLMDGKTRAQLRRMDPFQVSGAWRWVSAIKKSPVLASVEDADLVRRAPLVALLRNHTEETLGQQLKAAGINERHVRRLLAADRQDIDEQLQKIVRLLKFTANPIDLVATAIYWGVTRQRQIATAYFREKSLADTE